MKIGELSKLSGLAPSRIRFYEASGLISATRQANGYREYPPQSAQTLAIITCAQQAGFSLEEIRRLLPNANGWVRDELLVGLRLKVEEIEAMQQRLEQSKAQLLATIAGIESKPDGMQCTENVEQVLANLHADQIAGA